MAANIIDIADAVVTGLNSQSFSQSFTAVRDYVYDISLPDHSSLTVSVWPAGYETSPVARAAVEREYAIHVRVAKKVAVTSAAERKSSIDPMMLLVEEIANYIEPTETSAELGPDGATWVATDNNEIDYEQLNELNQFSLVLTFTFRKYE